MAVAPLSGRSALAPAATRDRERVLKGDGLSVTHAEVFAFAVLAVVAGATILWLGRSRTFTADEFDLLGRRLVLIDFLRPHNEHLTALPVLAYQTLMAVFGTGTYVPYLTLLAVLHIVAAAGVALLVRGRLGLMAASVVLFLGSGAENLFWAFQIGFVGSVAAGLWAMRVERSWLSAVLLGVSLGCSGIGLVFVLPVAVVRGRGAAWLAAPLALYGLWFTGFGTRLDHSGTLAQTAEWFVLGIGWAFGSLFGVGLAIGLGLVVAVGGLALIHRPDRLTAAALIGVVAEYGLIAVSRAGMQEVSFVAASRYVYVAAPFLLITMAGLIHDRRLLATLYVLVLVLNIAALPAGSAVP